MAKKVRIGFIGTGGIAGLHWPQMSKVQQAEIVALNDPSQVMIDRFYKRFPDAAALPMYADYRDMIRKEELDGVVIMSPHTPHYGQIKTCLEKGLHVLSEKPMTCTISHAKSLIEVAKKANRVLMISYQRHFDPQFRYMREQVAKGKIGEVTFVQAVLCQEWLNAVANTWRQEMALSGGGQINDSGSHLVDILMWVTGMKVKEVYAAMEFFGREVDINSALAMTFENGAIGNLSVIGNAPNWHEDHTIVGTKGALYLRQGIGLTQFDAKGKPVPVKLPKYSENPDSNFVKCILGKATPETPPECGLRTIEVTEAAWKSAKSGKPVRVP